MVHQFFVEPPTASISVRASARARSFISSFINPQFVNFAGDFKSIWVSDVGNYQYGAFLYQISTSNGKVLKKISKGLSFFDPPTGVASGPGPL